MKFNLIGKRVTALAVTAFMSATCMTGLFANSENYLVDNSITVFAAETSVKVLSSVGYNEGAYVTWSSVSGATGYNVYADGTQIDSMLIRQYSGYMRADALGLKAGSHTLKIVPLINGKEDSSKSAETKVNVTANDRSGFAFVGGEANGAYNSDGTLKSNATVVYVTNANKDNVTVTLPDKKGTATTYTGVQNIILALKSNEKCGPVAIRIIGNITDPSVLTKGDLYIDTATCGLTVEGIGNDATLNGFGLVMKNSSNVEVRNLGFMNCDSSEGDNCGLQQGNNHVWVHHCDFFYGDAGSDADQVKGDGALDTKTSTYITHSYNHFFDNGKCNLQGMKSEQTTNYITYHHNWYDHSDSRHPRIRTCSVHSYNNYFDGNAKYGIGVTLSASCFSENNYFRNCNYPMLSSMQGSDIANGTANATFSSENGGIIKSYGNYMEGQKGYVTYQQDNSSFDAYEATSRTEKVPSSVVTKQGGTSYNNFDTDSGIMYSYTPDSAKDVPSIVTANAGRVDGGDFKWTFTSADDESYSVNQPLKDALVAYKDSIVAIGSGFKEDNTPAQTTATTQGGSSAVTTSTTKAQSSTTAGNYVHDFTANGTSSTFYTISGNLSTAKGSVTYNGLTLTQCLKLETATSITFSGSGKLTLVFGDPSSTVKIDGTKYTADASGILTADLSAGTHTIAKADSANLFYMVFSGEGSSTPAQTTTTKGGTQPTTTTTAGQSSGSQEVNGIKVLSAGGWNEMAYLVFSGIKDADVTGVSYSGASNGSLTGDDLKYLVRDTSSGLRVDIPGLSAGTYSITLTTSKGTITQKGVKVEAQDRSGYAHYNYSEGVGAYKDNGELKANAIVLYVTDENKDTVSVTSKDGTKVTGIGNILNSAGMDNGSGKTANGGTANSNQGIIKKLAEDGTPLVIRIVGNVTAPAGVTEFDSVNYGGSVGDNGGMARMKSGKDITIEGIGTDACVNGWGFHFMSESSAPSLGKSFEVRNIAFRNAPEDCVGMEGVQEGSTVTAPVERCWIHNCEFYVPSIANPAESDKAQGDGACDFKRGNYFTNSYCYYEGYHKTNLVGASDSNLQFNLTYHHNYWKDCESRGPLARQANIHMYNNIFENQSSYCQNTRANAYIFSEYNIFNNCKSPQSVDSGAIKSFNDVLTNCSKLMQATTVTDKSTKVTSGNQYENFDTNSSLSYIPSGNYMLHTNTNDLAGYFGVYGGCMDETNVVIGTLEIGGQSATTTTTTTTQKPVETATTTVANPDADVVFGDANGDNETNLADAVFILQAIANPDKYIISDKGRNNADVYNRGDGITAMDALSIQKKEAGLLESLPESYLS